MIKRVEKGSGPTSQHRLLTSFSTLVDDELPTGFEDFTTSNGIHHIVIGIKGTKKATIPVDVMRHVLRTVLDESHHPLLVHCNQGKVSLTSAAYVILSFSEVIRALISKASAIDLKYTVRVRQ